MSENTRIFIEGDCPSFSRNVPYLPVIEILKSRFGVFEGEDEKEIREKVTKGLKELGVDEVSTLPYVLDLLSVGYTVKEVGELLHISPNSVVTHREHLKEKYGCKNSIRLIK